MFSARSVTDGRMLGLPARASHKKRFLVNVPQGVPVEVRALASDLAGKLIFPSYRASTVLFTMYDFQHFISRKVRQLTLRRVQLCLSFSEYFVSPTY